MPTKKHLKHTVNKEQINYCPTRIVRGKTKLEQNKTKLIATTFNYSYVKKKNECGLIAANRTNR